MKTITVSERIQNGSIVSIEIATDIRPNGDTWKVLIFLNDDEKIRYMVTLSGRCQIEYTELNEALVCCGKERVYFAADNNYEERMTIALKEQKAWLESLTQK